MTLGFLILSSSLPIRWRVSSMSGTSRVTESDYLNNVSRSMKASPTSFHRPSGLLCRGVESSCQSPRPLLPAGQIYETCV